MKSNKGYVFSTLAVQFLLVPIILTGALSVLPMIFNVTRLMDDYGRDTQQLVTSVLVFVIALLTGGAVGYIFSKTKTKTKPETSKVRYIPLLIPLVYAGMFAILATSNAAGKPSSIWWGYYTLKNPAFLIIDFVLAFMGMTLPIIVAEIMAYTGFVSGVILHEAKTKTSISDKPALGLKATFCMLFIVIIAFASWGHASIIQNGIVEVMYGQSSLGKDLTEYDLFRIAPFKDDNGLAKLGREASLQFTEFDDMPRVDGATAFYPVYAAFVESVYKGLGDYVEENKNDHEKMWYDAFVSSDKYPFNIVQCQKTSRAYERLIHGEVDIIFTLEPSKGHLEAIKAKGDQFVLTPIASEAFVFFTNIRNPIDNLTISQIQDIYAGKITNWKEVGGQNKKILPFQRPENSGSQTTMLNRVMKDIKMLEPEMETYAGGMGMMISQVANYKNAKNSIGYSFMYYSSSMIQNNQIKYIGINGVKPTPETVLNKTYPFTVPAYAVTLKSNTNENVQKFIEWILSDEGQELIHKTGYISIKQ